MIREPQGMQYIGIDSKLGFTTPRNWQGYPGTDCFLATTFLPLIYYVSPTI